ncbi:hypothetical protein [uncultured Draconibacterium sp.]|nr:hypothetical protein [uncultured Draconibacterium sp.]
MNEIIRTVEALRITQSDNVLTPFNRLPATMFLFHKNLTHWMN